MVAGHFSASTRSARGTVLDVPPTLLGLESGRGYTIQMGFVCEPSACALLGGLVKGAKIEANFGATLVGGRDTFVNKLLHVSSGETEGRTNDFQPTPCVGAAWALYLLLLPSKDTAPWPHTGVFTGYYRRGFEISDLRPAGTNEVWWCPGVQAFSCPAITLPPAILWFGVSSVVLVLRGTWLRTDANFGSLISSSNDLSIPMRK